MYAWDNANKNVIVKSNWTVIGEESNLLVENQHFCRKWLMTSIWLMCVYVSVALFLFTFRSILNHFHCYYTCQRFFLSGKKPNKSERIFLLNICSASVKSDIRKLCEIKRHGTNSPTFQAKAAKWFLPIHCGWTRNFGESIYKLIEKKKHPK